MNDPSAVWTRLLVRLPDTDDGAEAEQRLAAAVVEVLGDVDHRGLPWVVEPLFAEATEPELRSCLTVSGTVAAVPAYDSSRTAYDLATALGDHLHTEVEPDLPSTSYRIGPQPAPSRRPIPAAESKRWAIEAVRAPEAWALPLPPGGRAKGEGVLVGSVDTGYTDHPELAGALSFDLDRDVLDRDDDARDPLRRRPFSLLDTPGHGTTTMSVVASRETGVITGSAPLATVVPVRSIHSVALVLDGDVARGVHEAHRRGCRVITMSLGGRGFFGLREAIRAAVADGVIVMAAAGNYVGVVVAPAVYPECLAVAGTNAANEPWVWSSRGDPVDISAPGESVWVAAVEYTRRPPGFVEVQQSGTSFAVATLAGVAALWIAHHGYDQIVETYGRPHVQQAFLALLRSHGHWTPPGWEENGWGDLFGVGIVDAAGLLCAGLPEIATLHAIPAELGTTARLNAVLGELDRDQVISAVGALLGVEPDEVETLPSAVVSELVYRLGEDAELRLSLVAAARAPTSDAVSAPMRDARRLLERTSSAALLRRAGATRGLPWMAWSP